MADIENLRWAAEPNDFAVRLIIPDLNGIFKLGAVDLPKQRMLVVEAGTRAFVVDEGCVIGEVPPGSYLLQTFLERLQFWRERQVTVVLARQEDVAISIALQVPTAEYLTVNAKVRLTVQIEDVGAFLENLLGAQERLLINHVDGAPYRSLVRLAGPLVRQALWGAMRSRSISELMAPDVQQQLSTTVSETVCESLKRYGLRFVEVQMLMLEQEQHGELAERASERWIEDEEKRLKILRLQTESQLAADETDKRLARNAVRRDLMAALNAGKMDTVNSEEELRQFALDIDRQKLLRKDEREQFVAEYLKNRKNREQTLKLLQIEQRLEIEAAREDLDFAVRTLALEHEIEISKLAHSKRNQEWQQRLQLDRDRLQFARDERLKANEFKRDEVRRDAALRRTEDVEKMLNRQRLEEIANEVEVARRERKNRVSMLEIELKAHLEEQNLELTKRRKAWELDHKNQTADSQIERMRRVQEMNIDFEQRRKQNDLDLELLRDDRSHARELDRLRLMGELGTEALIATADSDNAAALADMKKQEFLTQSRIETAEALNAERLRLYEKLNDTEREKADAIAAAYQRAMHSQQELASDVSHAKRPTVVAGGLGGVVAVPGAGSVSADAAASGSPPPIPESPIWYIAIGGQQSGPLTATQVRSQIATGAVTRDTLAWNSSMSGWQPMGQLGDWANAFGPSQQPPPL